MKKLIFALLALAFFLGSNPANAQGNNDETKTVGGFGHFFIGPAFIQSKKVNDYLKRSDVMGSSYSPATFGYTIGGEGAAILNRFIIGGGGFGVVTPSISTDSSRAQAAMGGGYFKVGYIFHQKPNTFMYGYASFGGSGYSLQLSNLGDSTPINFNRKYPTLPGKKDYFSFGGFLFDFGVSLKTIAVGNVSKDAKKKGGFMIGVDLGCAVTLPISDWESGNNNNNNNNNNNTNNRVVVTGPSTPSAMFSPYFRLTIGGGGFRNKRF